MILNLFEAHVYIAVMTRRFAPLTSGYAWLGGSTALVQLTLTPTGINIRNKHFFIIYLFI